MTGTSFLELGFAAAFLVYKVAQSKASESSVALVPAMSWPQVSSSDLLIVCCLNGLTFHVFSFMSARLARRVGQNLSNAGFLRKTMASPQGLV